VSIRGKKSAVSPVADQPKGVAVEGELAPAKDIAPTVSDRGANP
jgi:hypothetical protein